MYNLESRSENRMTYPLISEYVEAVRNAEDNFDKLRNLRAVTDDNGNPVMTSGNFAVVFKMQDEKNDKLYAVKCFLKDQPNRAENYRMIAEELEYVSSSFLTKFQYLDNELFVDAAHADGEEFPVLLMDWVEGTNLDQYIRQHLHDTYQLHLLAYQFSRLALWLMPQPFAHGDLKPDNIMVREDGTLVLIDYDGMFVQAMKGQKARKMGSPDFRHPACTEDTFNEHIDDFSLASILLSLRVIAEEPALLEKYGAADRLLFSEKDYKNIHDCQLLKDIFPSECPEVNTLVGLFIIALTQSDLSNVSFRLLSLERPKEPEIEIISTEVTEEDKKDAWTDEFGVKYSKDGKKLLGSTDYYSLKNYTIRQGTRCICDAAFAGDSFSHPSLQSITIPDSVTSIGDRAFYSCKSLQSVTIPKSVINIKGNPFAYCPAKVINHSKHFTIFEGNLYTSDRRKLISYLSKEKNFIIPDSVTSIGNYAFEHCWSLQSVTIPNSVTSIGNRAFEDCLFLQSVTIPDSVTSIGDYAFSGCSFLHSVTIPNSVTSISDHAFWWCKSLQSVTIPESVINIKGNPFAYCPAKVINHSNHFTIFEGNLYTSDRRKLISYLSKGENFTIPDSVTSIGNSAFEDCDSLQSVTIPDSVTSIGDWAFYGCRSLLSVTIPDSVTSIGNRAFDSCTSLQSVTIPNSVTSIGDEAFSGCSFLQSVSIPDSVTSIGDYAFSSCSFLQSVTIPNSVTSISDHAFWGCKSLQSVTIPDSVTSIGDSAFDECSSLQSVTISDSVTSIGDCAFSGCSSLQSLTIPESITNIKGNPFYNSPARVINHSNHFTIFEGNLYTSDRRKLISYLSKGENFTIPDSVTSIGVSAFYGCSSLHSVTIPDSVTSIGVSAFYGCSSLQSVTIPDSVTSIGYRAFRGCESLHSVTIPDSVTSIGDSVFENCSSLQSVTIPDSVTSIGLGAFLGCKSLQSVTIPDSVTSIGLGAFLGCKSLHSVTIPDSVISIGVSAFRGCSSLHSVTIPDSVTSIGDSAFWLCTSLQSIFISHKTYDRLKFKLRRYSSKIKFTD